MGVPWASGPDDDSITILATEAESSTAAVEEEDFALSILVLSQSFIATYSLADAGELTIGRSNTVEIFVDDPLVSRRHAIITAGRRPSIRDLGSSNGTVVHGVALEPGAEREIAIGDVILVGTAALLLQRRTAAVHPRRFWTQEQLEGRLADECARAARADRTFSVARLELGPHGSDTIGRHVLAVTLRTSDVVGCSDGSGFTMLLDVPGRQASLVMKRIADTLAEREVSARWGVAQYPTDGVTSDELLAHAQPARAALPTASSATGGTIVIDPRTRELFRTAERIAAGDISVLIIGETGVGKEVMAEEIHRRSRRAQQPFLRINCGALSETLLESELFGHERGAFTSAVAAKPGLLETANHGTVMLDEIGEMPMSLQVKLLRVLEEQHVRRVGGLKSIALDVRFVAATNRDLERAVGRGLFREDLYYRLAGATLEIPPLRERVEDLIPLAELFLARASRHLPRPATLTDAAIAQLRAHRWPGNIRELRHVMERAVLLAGSTPIAPAHLPVPKPAVPEAAVPERERTGRDDPATPTGSMAPLAPARPAGADAQERERLTAALASCGGNQSRAAKELGMSRGALIRRLEMYGIVRPRKPE